MEEYCVMDSPLGPLKITATDKGISGIAFCAESLRETDHPLLKDTEKQLREYFAGNRKVFDLPLDPQGTEFQKLVWQALRDIPFGATRSYGEIARVIGRPKAARAVGMANHVNPIVIVVPCHRVIGADGRLTGYGGGLDKKEYLLKHER